MKRKSEKQKKLDEAHALFLRKIGYSGKKRVAKRAEKPPVSQPVSSLPALSNQIPVGVAAKRPPQRYSGSRTLLGIAAMHKSNLVPVFSKEDAELISTMRR